MRFHIARQISFVSTSGQPSATLAVPPHNNNTAMRHYLTVCLLDNPSTAWTYVRVFVCMYEIITLTTKYNRYYCCRCRPLAVSSVRPRQSMSSAYFAFIHTNIIYSIFRFTTLFCENSCNAFCCCYYCNALTWLLQHYFGVVQLSQRNKLLLCEIKYECTEVNTVIYTHKYIYTYTIFLPCNPVLGSECDKLFVLSLRVVAQRISHSFMLPMTHHSCFEIFHTISMTA